MANPNMSLHHYISRLLLVSPECGMFILMDLPQKAIARHNEDHIQDQQRLTTRPLSVPGGGPGLSPVTPTTTLGFLESESFWQAPTPSCN